MFVTGLEFDDVVIYNVTIAVIYPELSCVHCFAVFC